MFNKKILAACVAAIVVSACGGSDDAPLKSTFIDAAVSGAAYGTATQSGSTAADGGFNYRPGESVTFTVGGVRLPAVAVPGGVVTPIDMGADGTATDPATLNIARFIQALDTDNNPDNGIVINAARVAPGATTPANWSAANPTALLAAGVAVPTEGQALTHLAKSVAQAKGMPQGKLVGRYGVSQAGVAEIVAYHEASKSSFHIADVPATAPATGRVLSVQRMSLANLSATALASPTTASNLTIDGTRDIAADVNTAGFIAGGIQSLDIAGNLMAVAVSSNPKTDTGVVAFYNISATGALTFSKKVTVGVLPDSVSFSPDGSSLVVANEGELSNTFGTDNIDPDGSISIVRITNGVPADNAIQLTFTDFNTGSSRASELPSGVRIGRPGATVAQDIEPEYVAISSDSRTAFVTLQENNAVAVVDLTAARISRIFALGFKDHGLARNAFAPSDRATVLNPPALITIPNVMGIYMPDTAASFTVGGKTYLVTANEGDDRNDFLPAEETARLSTLPLDPTAFPDAATIKANTVAGRLTVFATTSTGRFGDTDNDGDYDKVYALGGRSYSIIDAATGQLVYESGSDVERYVYGELANDANKDTLFADGAISGRFDNKGPEPEALTVGQIGNDFYAFIGLERSSSILVMKVTNPAKPEFVQYIRSTTNFANGDLSPEGMKFVPAAKSPNAKPLLIVGYGDVSGTVAVYQFD